MSLVGKLESLHVVGVTSISLCLCAHSHSSQRVLSGGAKWGCYELVSVQVLKISVGVLRIPLDPVCRRPCPLPFNMHDRGTCIP